jgi:hypothetical protein
MLSEWFLPGFLVLVALGMAWRAPRRPALAVVLMTALGLLGAGGWVWLRRAGATRPRIDWATAKLPAPGRPGFATSDSCAACHPDQHASWHRSYHRTMTQVASPTTTPADFGNVELELRGRHYGLRRRGDELFVELDEPPGPDGGGRPVRRERRVSLVTGSHHMQAFWLEDPRGNRQLSFPFSWLLAERRWVPRNDVFVLPPDAPTLSQTWNENCIRCHAVAGQPAPEVQGEAYRTQVAELGIACESCHGPGEAHVAANANPLTRYANHFRAGVQPDIVNPMRLDHRRSSETCGACHGVTWIPDLAAWRQTGFTYRPGGEMERDRVLVRYPGMKDDPRFPEAMRTQADVLLSTFWKDGEVRVSGREFNGLVESPCYQRGELSCLSCHSMHRGAPDDQLIPGRHEDQSCLQCHPKLAGDLRAHTRHAPESAGSRCVNCHMPHTTFGLLKAIRSHRITSPSARAELETGRPNACNLCHLDRPLAWTADRLRDWFGQRGPTPAELGIHAATATGPAYALTGDAAQRSLIAWHVGWAPARTASQTGWQFPVLAELLADPYSAVRYLAGHALRAQPGFADFKFDYVAPEPERRRQLESVLSQLQTHRSRRLSQPGAVLFDESGRPDRGRFEALRRQRNDRRVELTE